MKNPNQLPTSPQVFRKWLNRCIIVIGTDAVKVSRRAEIGMNTTGSFLRENRDIRLGVAGKLQAAVIAMALDAQKTLPTFEEVCPDE